SCCSMTAGSDSQPRSRCRTKGSSGFATCVSQATIGSRPSARATAGRSGSRPTASNAQRRRRTGGGTPPPVIRAVLRRHLLRREGAAGDVVGAAERELPAHRSRRVAGALEERPFVKAVDAVGGIDEAVEVASVGAAGAAR